MFCPGCGSEERQRSQFCRACGTDLRFVRVGTEQPDAITASAVTARDEIGRAVALKIKELKSAKDLAKVAEDVLPEIEKFLESPRERRLRRLRAGVITAAVGLGAMFFFFLMSLKEGDSLFLVALGLTVFFIGLGIVLNGLMFTVPDDDAPESLPAAGKRRRPSALDQPAASPALTQGELNTAQQLTPPPSVAEHTTHRLSTEAAKAVPQRIVEE